MRKSGLALVVVVLLISFSVFVSASVFSDAWSWITGRAGENNESQLGGDGDAPVEGGGVEPGQNTHGECDREERQCKQVPGPGINECFNHLDCAPDVPVYSVCEEGACVEVVGVGEDECWLSTNCGVDPEIGIGEIGEKHSECRDEQCVEVSGPGQDECSSEVDCISGEKHSICQNEQCVVVPGEGQNQCSFDSDCKSVHAECVNYQCRQIPGPGNDRCRFDVECTQTEFCSDEDVTQNFPNGFNPYRKSEASDRIITTEDWCRNSQVVVEHGCVDNKLTEKLISCDDLGLECLDGVCVHKRTFLQNLVSRIFDI